MCVCVPVVLLLCRYCVTRCLAFYTDTHTHTHSPSLTLWEPFGGEVVHFSSKYCQGSKMGEGLEKEKKRGGMQLNE